MNGRGERGTDEFDVEPEPGVRRGAHRATLSPLVRALPWVLGALLAVAVVVAVVSFVGGGQVAGVQGAGRPVGSGESVTSEATASRSATASASVPPSGEAPSSGEPAGEPDFGVGLAVLNGTATAGVAAGAATALEQQGWTVVEIADYPGGSARTTVYYAAEALAVTAQAVAAEVGGVAQLDPAQTDAIAVVLGDDYSP